MIQPGTNPNRFSDAKRIRRQHEAAIAQREEESAAAARCRRASIIQRVASRACPFTSTGIFAVGFAAGALVVALLLVK